MNLEQIAELSGVSRSTVSRVINNDPNVSDQTREKVLQVVRRVNYVPNAPRQRGYRSSQEVQGMDCWARTANMGATSL